MTLIAVIALEAVFGGLWAIWQLPRPQFVTLPNGDRYRLAGVTWGTNHVEPTLAARVARRIPLSLTNVVQRVLGKHLGPITSFKTDEPSLFVWFQPLARSGQSSPLNRLSARLADQNGVTGNSPGVMVRGTQWAMIMSPAALAGRGNAQYGAATFTVLPRRSPVLQCVLFEAAAQGVSREVGCVRFLNPVFGRFPQWQPETLPATKRVGDFEVCLEKLQHEGFGASQGPDTLSPIGRASDYRTTLKGEKNVFTAFSLSVGSLSGTDERYQIVSSELSDATGNHIRGFLESYPFLTPMAGGTSRIDSYGNVIDGVLWPDEAAWRLKVELKRDSGFSAPELVTFKGVPLLNEGAEDIIRLTNLVGGTQFVLSERVLIQNGRNPVRQRFQLEMASLPHSISLAWVKVTTDAGVEADASKPSWSQGYNPGRPEQNAHFSSDFVLRSVPAGVTTVDITWAMHRTRTVEFLVAPPKRE